MLSYHKPKGVKMPKVAKPGGSHIMGLKPKGVTSKLSTHEVLKKYL